MQRALYRSECSVAFEDALRTLAVLFPHEIDACSQPQDMRGRETPIRFQGHLFKLTYSLWNNWGRYWA